MSKVCRTVIVSIWNTVALVIFRRKNWWKALDHVVGILIYLVRRIILGVAVLRTSTKGFSGYHRRKIYSFYVDAFIVAGVRNGNYKKGQKRLWWDDHVSMGVKECKTWKRFKLNCIRNTVGFVAGRMERFLCCYCLNNSGYNVIWKWTLI